MARICWGWLFMPDRSSQYNQPSFNTILRKENPTHCLVPSKKQSNPEAVYELCVDLKELSSGWFSWDLANLGPVWRPRVYWLDPTMISLKQYGTSTQETWLLLMALLPDDNILSISLLSGPQFLFIENEDKLQVSPLQLYEVVRILMLECPMLIFIPGVTMVSWATA